MKTLELDEKEAEVFEHFRPWATACGKKLANRCKVPHLLAANYALCGLIEAIKLNKPQHPFEKLAITSIWRAVVSAARDNGGYSRHYWRKMKRDGPRTVSHMIYMSTRGGEPEFGTSSRENVFNRFPDPRPTPAEQAETADTVARFLQKLSGQEKEVVDRYYFQHQPMREIGDALGVSESRVAQIHAAAIERMRRVA